MIFKKIISVFSRQSSNRKEIIRQKLSELDRYIQSQNQQGKKISRKHFKDESADNTSLRRHERKRRGDSIQESQDFQYERFPFKLLMPVKEQLNFFQTPSSKKERIWINGIDPKNMRIMNSKEQPIQFAFRGSDGEIYRFLMKRESSSNTDVRKESRVIDMIDYLDQILKNDSITKKFKLTMRSYVIISLTRNVNLVEWVEGTNTLKNLIVSKDPELMSRKIVITDDKKFFPEAFRKVFKTVG